MVLLKINTGQATIFLDQNHLNIKRKDFKIELLAQVFAKLTHDSVQNEYNLVVI